MAQRSTSDPWPDARTILGRWRQGSAIELSWADALQVEIGTADFSRWAVCKEIGEAKEEEDEDRMDRLAWRW